MAELTFGLMLTLATVYAGVADLGRTGTVVLYLCVAAALCQLLSEPALSAFRAGQGRRWTSPPVRSFAPGA